MLVGGLMVIVFAAVLWHFIVENLPQEAEQMHKRKVTPQNARDILIERYANGKISREDYLTALEDIESFEAHR